MTVIHAMFHAGMLWFTFLFNQQVKIFLLSFLFKEEEEFYS
jgi:hypothetical protein